MAAIWIVHREAGVRTALARLAGAADDAVLGAPTDPRFHAARGPDLVILGLAGDLEQELEFAHALSARHPDAAWILLADPGDADEVIRLFDTIPAEVLHFPSEGTLLRRRVRAARTRRRAATLSERRSRDAVAARFGRWFADLELPALLRALDPKLAEVPLLIRGEPGTGRGLLAAYVHAFGSPEGGHLARIACSGLDVAGLREEIARAAAEPAAHHGLTVCLEEVELLPLSAQRRLRGWMEAGLPPGVAGPTPGVRWVATCSELGPHDPAESLDLGLAQVVAGLEVRIPPLRERPRAIEPLVANTALEWSAARGEPLRRFSREALELLAGHPWPGNVRELEAAVVRTLAASGDEVIPAEALRFETTWPEPVLARNEELSDAGIPAAVEAGSAAAGPAPAPRHERAAVPDPAPTPRPEPERDATAEPSVPASVDPTPASKPEAAADEPLRRLIGAITHEVRNPLVAIRTFSALLPERFDDPDFRGRFAAIVGDDVRRIEGAVDRLARFASLGAPERKSVDVSALLDDLLESRRDEIRDRRLVVLRELDREHGTALGDAAQLRFAFEALLGKALELVPDRGDVYVASRHHRDALHGRPSLRVLLRFQSPDEILPTVDVEGISMAETALELVLADAIVRSQGGQMTASTADSRETVLLIDLPA